VTEPKTPLEQALEVFVYLPVGIAMTAREELPRVIEKGRLRVANEVTMARAVGQFVATQGQKEAEKAVRAAANRWMAPPPRPASRQAPAPAPAPSSGGPGGPNGSQPAAEANGWVAPPVANLAIPGYDTLSASQVVQRLAGLAPGELEAVRAYESATRQRRTILTKVAQLQEGAPG
jgi:hypothetical protein